MKNEERNLKGDDFIETSGTYCSWNNFERSKFRRNSDLVSFKDFISGFLPKMITKNGLNEKEILRDIYEFTYIITNIYTTRYGGFYYRLSCPAFPGRALEETHFLQPEDKLIKIGEIKELLIDEMKKQKISKEYISFFENIIDFEAKIRLLKDPWMQDFFEAHMDGRVKWSED